MFHLNRRGFISILIILSVVFGIGIHSRHRAENVEVFSVPANKRVIIIDAGHGGRDPGVVSASGILEKDINLAVALQLQMLLENGGAYVIMTRADDDALGGNKTEDMNRRRIIADEAQADIFISIHQNAYASPNVRGAQAFYYGDSENGKLLAEFLQEQFKTYLDRDNRRVAAANQQYYVLRRTKIPSVLVECGYLTNPNESNLLTTEEYQNKVAWAIYMGILNYFSNLPQPPVSP